MDNQEATSSPSSNQEGYDSLRTKNAKASAKSRARRRDREAHMLAENYDLAQYLQDNEKANEELSSQIKMLEITNSNLQEKSKLLKASIDDVHSSIEVNLDNWKGLCPEAPWGEINEVMKERLVMDEKITQITTEMVDLKAKIDNASKGLNNLKYQSEIKRSQQKD
ncbi:hypothetical protein DSO57_1003577 [Entomophthora muscae]|uniref:Uncharacterized protein n=1 Tax=Entomophthora muscae TaxID=34485 RepID=A0ACC2TWI0_9FUNG|nr:hypothetical protein DSO57_1003577 [Entomophthora muscae]